MVQIVILAAGKGTRMGSDLPKVLVSLNERPMICYLLDSVVDSLVDSEPIIIVSPDNQEIIKKALTDYRAQYVIQDKQLGTGHAVSCARDFIKKETEKIIVLYGDHPFLKAQSIINFSKLQPQAVTIMPTTLPDFSGWHHNFYGWGRIVRSDKGEVKAIVELKDASFQEKEITEVNPGFMCFNKNWLFKNIDKLQDNNKAHEFYLTDMIKIAFSQGYKIDTLAIEPQEAMGINTPEELKIAIDLNNNN
ncbi:MAG: bifunctional UDP-N-acetylglucosamine pyrophosphorylase / glucosamine-phosphate N-acetyltransferase [Patescibacteria group bacterium]|nr:bifunctional UDP-N-acetylglucosamine pyrophosphorylase / glucosamine-phosphate N-acetyltransferase [Patescibacteria group bacterium]